MPAFRYGSKTRGKKFVHALYIVETQPDFTDDSPVTTMYFKGRKTGEKFVAILSAMLNKGADYLSLRAWLLGNALAWENVVDKEKRPDCFTTYDGILSNEELNTLLNLA